MYDVLYALSPLQTALCAKDTSGTYCTLSTAKNSTVSSSSSSSHLSNSYLDYVKEYLFSSTTFARRDANAAATAFTLNATTWDASNLAFLLIQPTESAAELCTPCTRSVLSAYVLFENQTPYAPGMDNSALLSGQTALYKAVVDACGTDFMNAGSAAAGVVGGVATGGNGAAAAGVNGFLTAAAAAVVGMAALL